jgi:NifU-like protein involved in Fe-S cluster formation
MKVSEYVNKGLKNIVDEEPAGYESSGKCTQGCHSVTIFLKKEGGKIVDCKFKATKRCKKLLAVTDYMCELVKKKGTAPSPDEILSNFAEEKEKDKMENRVSIALTALESALA